MLPEIPAEAHPHPHDIRGQKPHAHRGRVGIDESPVPFFCNVQHPPQNLHNRTPVRKSVINASRAINAIRAIKAINAINAINAMKMMG